MYNKQWLLVTLWKKLRLNLSELQQVQFKTLTVICCVISIVMFLSIDIVDLLLSSPNQKICINHLQKRQIWDHCLYDLEQFHYCYLFILVELQSGKSQKPFLFFS